MRNNSNMAVLAAQGAALALLGACDDRPAAFERGGSVIGPVALDDRVAYVDGARDQVVVVTADASSPEVASYRIGRRAAYAAPSPDRTHLAVLTWGDEASAPGRIDEDPMLWYLDVTDPDAEPVGYPVGSPFGRIAIAPKGDGDGSPVAVAYHSPESASHDGVLRNPNELAIVDLSREPKAENPVLRSVRSFGSAPEGVILSPPMRIPGLGGDPRTLAFVLAEDTVTLLDTNHPMRDEVSLRVGGTGDEVMPRELAFEPDVGVAYLRSDGARDVLEIDLRPRERGEDDERTNDFRPALAELGAGGGPADIASYETEHGDRFVLAATPSTREVVLIDAATGEFRTVETPDPIDRVLLFPRGPDATPRTALLASIGAEIPRVHLLSLDELGDSLSAVRLETVSIERPVLDVAPIPNRELGLLVHDHDRTVLGLMDVAVGSVAPIEGSERLGHYEFTSSGSHLVTASSRSGRVGVLDLDSLHPSDMRLDAEPGRALAMAGDAIYVDHGDPFGMATILPGPGAERSEAVVISGFLVRDVLGDEH